MTKVIVGSIISGASGKRFVVDRVEGDIIYSGEFKIDISAVLKVEPPSLTDRIDGDTIHSDNLAILKSAVVQVIPLTIKFKLGDRVRYIGSDSNLKTQYAGMLKVWERSKNPLDGYTCIKPNGSLTSWVKGTDLESVDYCIIGDCVIRADLYHRYGG